MAPRVTIGCLIASVRPTFAKTGNSAGKKMAMITLEDLTGKADAVVFSDTYERLAGLIQDQALVFVSGSVDRQRERPNILVRDIVPIDQAVEQMTGAIHLKRLQPAADLTVRRQRPVRPSQGHHDPPPGQLPCVFARLRGRAPDVRTTIRPDRQWCLAPSRKLVDELVGLLGEENIVLCPKPPAATKPRYNGRAIPTATPMRRSGSGQPNPKTQGPASAAVTRFN